MRRLALAVRELFAMLEDRKLLDDTVRADQHRRHRPDHLRAGRHRLEADCAETTNHMPLLVLFPACYGVAPRKGQPGFFGRSLLPHVRTAAPMTPAAVAANDAFKPTAPDEKKRQDEEALRRLRSLGYLR